MTSVALRVAACVAFLDSHLAWGALLYLTGLALDGVDGKLARRLNRSSEFGGRLDFSSDYGLFAGLWVTVGLAASVWTPIIWIGVSAGVASAFVTILQPRTRVETPEGPREMVSSPGVLELHAATFGIAPLIGPTTIGIAMAISCAYFLLAWAVKLGR